MPVYVDDPLWPFRGMIMCHMVADSLDELHTMAELVGMRREWFQDVPKASHPHYDLNQERRALALEFGAIYLPSKVLAKAVIARRKAGNVGVLDIETARRWFAENGLSERFASRRG